MNLFSDWKTSIAGAIIIALAVLDKGFGIHIPGVDIAAGIGLLFAKDSN